MNKWLCAVALCAAAGTASAESYWSFTYTGFLNEATQQFEAARKAGGSFRGTDRNADGILERGELTEFSWESAQLDIRSDYCGMYNNCDLDQFSYDIRAGQLNFAFDGYFSDEGSSSAFGVIAGQRYGYGGMGGGEELLWTPRTRFDITPAPVPEPATAWMLGAGLTALGVAARRRRRD